MITKHSKNAEDIFKKMGPFTFGMFIRSMRTTLDLTQIQMAKNLGITKGTLCDIEKGRQIVSVQLAKKIAKKCGFSELLAIESCLQDQLVRAKISFKVKLIA